MKSKASIGKQQGSQTKLRPALDSINLSFTGCGFIGIYYLGVAACFREYCPQVFESKVSGVSIGAAFATLMACKLPL
ncbi:patatin-like phospholipase domain-containing protein 2, partial [Dinothrombium tinctorium]